ncbi:MAG TPA: tellurite resistance TerB family protein [Steroidobacteraceae bacterium]|jgi:uncharacterized membrane protein YebE (DUF533 family)|nr:tellurite resistance TerB family protein [Steroidobacteraceae bacterium]
MVDPKQLLEQMLGGNTVGGLRNMGQLAKQRLDRASGAEGFAGGAIAGGLLGLLLGSGKMQRMGGGLLGYGGAALLGALAHRAYQNYQAGRPVDATPQATPAELEQVPAAQLPHAAPAAGGGPFELVLIEAMVAAAKADGHVDAEEQRRLFAEVERAGLDSAAKAHVFDLLSRPVDVAQLSAKIATPQQAGEVYLASRLAIDPDDPTERAYLDSLAAQLKLPAELRAHLDKQATGQAIPSS